MYQKVRAAYKSVYEIYAKNYEYFYIFQGSYLGLREDPFLM